MLYDEKDFAALVQGAKSMPANGIVEGKSIIFIPNKDKDEDDGYLYAHRYVKAEDDHQNTFLYDAGCTDIGPTFVTHNGVELPANAISVDFVSGGIQYWVNNRTLKFDCHLNAETKIYVD